MMEREEGESIDGIKEDMKGMKIKAYEKKERNRTTEWINFTE